MRNVFHAAAAAIVMTACGSSAGGGQGPASSGLITGSQQASAPVGGEQGGTSTGSEQRRSGLSVHIQNVHAGGALPAEPSPRFDRLEVNFELNLEHHGEQRLTGINVARARLLHDDGREIVFGVLGENWDGRLESGERRVVAFHKTPDSASPPPSREYCGLPMRLEVTLDLAGRRATATSRRFLIDCPPAQ